MGCEGLEEEGGYLMEIDLVDWKQRAARLRLIGYWQVKAAKRAYSVRRRQAGRGRQRGEADNTTTDRDVCMIALSYK